MSQFGKELSTPAFMKAVAQQTGQCPKGSEIIRYRLRCYNLGYNGTPEDFISYSQFKANLQ